MDSRSYSRSTPLHEAVCNKQRQSVEQLIDAHCAIDVFDRDGESPLCLAIAMQNEEIISVLLKSGAKLLRNS